MNFSKHGWIQTTNKNIKFTSTQPNSNGKKNGEDGEQIYQLLLDDILGKGNPSHFPFGMRSGPLRIRQFPGGGKTLPLIGDFFPSSSHAEKEKCKNTNCKIENYKNKQIKKEHTLPMDMNRDI